MELEDISKSWPQEQVEVESTMEPGGPVLVTVVEEHVPTLTVGALAGVAVVVVLAIVGVFLLGVFIDKRQQNKLAKKMEQLRKLRNHKRVARHLETDCTSITNNMEETAESIAPADILRNIP